MCELKLCLLGNFSCFFVVCRLLIFFKINFFEKFFREYHQSVKQLGNHQMTLEGKEFEDNSNVIDFVMPHLTS